MDQTGSDWVGPVLKYISIKRCGVNRCGVNIQDFIRFAMKYGTANSDHLDLIT